MPTAPQHAATSAERPPPALCSGVRSVRAIEKPCTPACALVVARPAANAAASNIRDAIDMPSTPLHQAPHANIFSPIPLRKSYPTAVKRSIDRLTKQFLVDL